ncbi:uncharacterized protein KY384_003880 [Bacidia gigantensis]|uniref:uncharacterized protein n=1 Tax=Bacidia gigantensis TaxID=2732470 RepID=UPI001D058A7E|nr:uncharacterized protein KY384_003880 [Bacidia gigantensis]KAG8532239.1 hypothetical protein KY384_003880 [Bacidia gigantensis]
MVLSNTLLPGLGFSWDTGSYRDMIGPATAIVQQCVETPFASVGVSVGGFDYVGDRRQLILSMMAPKSNYDKVMVEVESKQQGLCAATKQRLDGQLGVMGYESCTPGSTQDDGERFADDVLNDRYNVLPDAQTALNQLGLEPTCGQPCSGSKNPCTGGCHCGADLLESLGSFKTQFKCIESYFTFASRRRSLSSLPAGVNDLGSISAGINTDTTIPPTVDDIAIFLAPGPEPEPESTFDWPRAPHVTFDHNGSITGGAEVCPCNCTYISISCCVSDTGLVYEPADYKLGAVQPDSGQCCDSKSGQMKEGSPNGGDGLC